MSVALFIKKEKPLDDKKFNEIISGEIENLEIIKDKNHNGYFYSIEKKSIRGLFIGFSEDALMIRIYGFANEEDFRLANYLIKRLMETCNGILISEYGKIITDTPALSQEIIDEIAETHINLLVYTENSENNLSVIPGTNRHIYFGSRLIKDLKKLKYEETKKKVFEILLNANYKYPALKEGNLHETDFNSDGNYSRVKLLSNDTDLLIAKYDYIVLYDATDDKLIFITNDILNDIIPEKWELLDEYNIAAWVLEDKEWSELISKAKPFDLSEQLFKNTKDGKKTD